MGTQPGFIRANGSVVNVDVGGSTFQELEGVGGWTSQPQTAPITNEPLLNGKAISFPGVEPIGSISVAVPAFVPYTREWQVMRAAKTANSTVNVRLETQEAVEYTSPTAGRCEIAQTTGACTFTGNGVTHNDFSVRGRGFTIKIGTKYYVVATDGSGSGGTTGVTVYPAPTSAVSAGRYQVGIPKLMLALTCAITQMPEFNAAANGIASGTLILQPTASFGDPALADPAPAIS